MTSWTKRILKWSLPIAIGIVLILVAVRFGQTALAALGALSGGILWGWRKKYEKIAARTGRRVIDVAISDQLQQLKKSELQQG